ncbi:MAG: hypothetical protein HRU38_18110 [Saccharospirillaceae bacterium]|nr:hypothetical protein [Pseudomonadales bacterium]NRB80553.1 hypothetical protein [Saccharospirillaceae bacterium]
MRRIHFLADDIEQVEQVSNLVHQQGISDWHFHVASKQPEHLDKRHIKAANIFQRTEILQGAMVGVGLVLCLSFFVLGWFIDNGMFIQGEIVQPTGYFLSAAVLGLILGCAVGINTQSATIRRYHNAIDEGLFLVMIDVPQEKVGFIRSMIAKRNSASYQEDFRIHFIQAH